MSDLISELVAKINKLPEEAIKELLQQRAADKAPWFASEGPQLRAQLSQADTTLYGGQGGGGKSHLLLGLAFTEHQRSLILRRRYVDLGALIEDALKINGGRDGFNGSPPPKIRTRDGRLIEFGAAANVGDEQSWQGQPHDFLGIDEAAQWAESQIRFLMGWVRTTDPGQRTRVVLATNPPLSSEGQWLIDMFRPWLDPGHPHPAKHGELRWYITAPDGKDQEVNGPEPLIIAGETYRPLSRTFIPAKVTDNPFLRNSGYQAQLDNMKEPWRSAIRDGNFMAARSDDPFQLIPSDWIRQAQARHAQRPPDAPMAVIAVDVAQGGDDETVLAIRRDWWFADLIVVPGKQTPLPSDVAALVVKYRRDGAVVVVDVGGGYGGGVCERLKDNGIDAIKFNGAASGHGRTHNEKQPFVNKRAQAWWRFREALDPDQNGGSSIALPNDPALAADLCAPRFEITARGVQIESKDDIKRRLGRSPDRGDAVVMAWDEGQRAIRKGLAGLGVSRHSSYRDRQTHCKMNERFAGRDWSRDRSR